MQIACKESGMQIHQICGPGAVLAPWVGKAAEMGK